MLKLKNHNSCCKIFILQFAIYLTVALLLSGCGKKRPPIPPKQAKPQAVKNLQGEMKEGKVTLIWNKPGEKKPVLSGFIVFRSKESLSNADCKNCPKVFKRIADIPAQGSDAAKNNVNIMYYNEMVEKGYKYIYKVIGYTDSNAASNDSNYVEFTY